MIDIVVMNESSAVADSAVQGMIPAFAEQWNRDLAPVWGLEQVSFAWADKEQTPPPGMWWVVFLDDSDQADALAYHDLTNDGLPISKVFVKTILADDASLSVGATHEICEMAVDPWLNGAFQDSRGVFWASEICDPVEDDRYSYEIGGTLVTNFVTPTWFAHQHARGKLDLRSDCKSPFEVLTGGYAQYFDAQRGWQQVTGNRARASKRATPPRGSRRERRARQWQNWSRSERHLRGR